jgi:PPOX class probable F420-dependent enzyme
MKATVSESVQFSELIKCDDKEEHLRPFKIIILCKLLEQSKNKDNNAADHMARLLKDKNFAFLGTIMKDGRPQVSPVWIDVDNGLILINTAEGRIKHRNLSRDPRVSISLVDRNSPYSMVTIQGKVVDQTFNGADDHIDKLAKKYLDVDKYPAHSPSVKRVIVKIKPDKIFYLPPRYTEYLKDKR